MHSEKCIVQNPSGLQFYSASESFGEAELRFAVLIDEIAMATSSLDSFINGAALCWSVFPQSTSSSVQYPDSSASSSMSPIFDIKVGLDFARQAAR